MYGTQPPDAWKLVLTNNTSLQFGRVKPVSILSHTQTYRGFEEEGVAFNVFTEAGVAVDEICEARFGVDENSKGACGLYVGLYL